MLLTLTVTDLAASFWSAVKPLRWILAFHTNCCHPKDSGLNGPGPFVLRGCHCRTIRIYFSPWVSVWESPCMLHPFLKSTGQEALCYHVQPIATRELPFPFILPCTPLPHPPVDTALTHRVQGLEESNKYVHIQVQDGNYHWWELPQIYFCCNKSFFATNLLSRQT